MRIIIRFIMLMLLINLGAQSFTEKEPELVKVFPVGDSNGELGYEIIHNSSETGWPPGLCFDSDGNLVVSDYVNRRIVFFDKNWEYIKNVKLDGSLDAIRMEVDSEGNFIGYRGRLGIKKIDKYGKILFYINLTGEEIADKIRDDGLYIVDDMVIAHDKDTGEIIGFEDLMPDYRGYNSNKQILNTQQVIRELESHSSPIRIEKKETVQTSARMMNSETSVPTREQDQNEYIIMQNGEVISKDFNTLQQLRPQQFQAQRTSQQNINPLSNELNDLFNKFFNSRLSKVYYGKDLNNNEYWKIGAYMFVLNSGGNPISAIRIYRIGNTSGFTVSEAGDIYYLSSSGEGHKLFRINRDW